MVANNQIAQWKEQYRQGTMTMPVLLCPVYAKK